MFPRKWPGLSFILQYLEMQKKRKIKGFVNHSFEIFRKSSLSLRMVFSSCKCDLLASNEISWEIVTDTFF